MFSFDVDYINEARSEKNLDDRYDRADDRFNNSHLSKATTRSLTFDGAPLIVNGKGKPVRKVIVGDITNPHSYGAGMSDEMRQKYREVVETRDKNVSHEKETLDMMDAANVPKDDELYRSQTKAIADAESSTNAARHYAERYYHSMRDNKTAEQRLAKHRNKVANKTGSKQEKAARAALLQQQTDANSSGSGGKQKRAARQAESRERRRKASEWLHRPDDTAPQSSSNQRPQPAPRPEPQQPPTEPRQPDQRPEPKTNPQPQNTSPSGATKPKFHITGKQAAGAALAVTGVTAAGLGARYLYKKRQERKRKEREAAEREARKPINRLKRVFVR